MQIRQIINMSNVVVLQIEMGEVEGKAEVAKIFDLIVVEVQNSEVSAHGEITLKIKRQHKPQTSKKIADNIGRLLIMATYNIFDVLA